MLILMAVFPLIPILSGSDFNGNVAVNCLGFMRGPNLSINMNTFPLLSSAV